MKTKVLKLWFCLLLVVSLANSVFSQQSGSDSTFTVQTYNDNDYNEAANINFLNMGLGSMIPKNAFGQKLDKSLFNFNVSYFRQIKKYKPFFAGFEFAYAQIDSYNSDVPVTNDDGSISYWNENVTSNVMHFNLVGRYFLPVSVWRIEPFVEFNYGMQWFGTNSTLTDGDSEDSDSEYLKNDLVGKYGFASGFNFRVKDNYYGLFRIGYDSGLSAYYYTLKDKFSLPLNYVIDAFSLQKTTTDVLKWDIGFTFAF